jgi:oxidase EvaA
MTSGVLYDWETTTSAEAARRYALSAETTDSPVTPTAEFHAWFAERKERLRFDVRRIPFGELSGWRFNPDTGNLQHLSGRFFSVEGVRVRTDRRWNASWTQPILVQPEIGTLGILTRDFDGIPHFLMQAKNEPGNVNGLQLSPTVQATRSNYTRVHLGREVRYLEYFASRDLGRPHVDVLQSEQASWFFHKRNRNLVVEALDEVPVHEDFRWLTLGQLRQFLHVPHLLHMTTRAVLACLPSYAQAGEWQPPAGSSALQPYGRALRHSLSPRSRPLHATREVLSWLTDLRSRRELTQQRVPLDLVAEGGWHRTEDEVAREDGRHFRIVAVDVRADNREVGSWTQPLLAPCDEGLIAFLTKQIDGTLHVLVHAHRGAGSLGGHEVAPTVQCQPATYRDTPAEHRPRFLEYVTGAAPARVRYDVLQSEEGGRFHNARNRYVVVEAGDDFPLDVPEDYCWITLRQLTQLLAHSNYVNIEARSLLACLLAVR